MPDTPSNETPGRSPERPTPDEMAALQDAAKIENDERRADELKVHADLEADRAASDARAAIERFPNYRDVMRERFGDPETIESERPSRRED